MLAAVLEGTKGSTQGRVQGLGFEVWGRVLTSLIQFKQSVGSSCKAHAFLVKSEFTDQFRAS